MSGLPTRRRARGTGSARSVVGARARTPWPRPIAVGVAAWVIALGALDARSVLAAAAASLGSADRPVAASGASARDTGGLPYLDAARASGHAAFVIERLDAGATSDARPTLALLARAPGVTPALGAAAQVLQETLDGTEAAPGVRAASARPDRRHVVTRRFASEVPRA